MTTKEAVNWIINVRADIGKIEHQELWHYEQALSEIMDVLENAIPVAHGRWLDGYRFQMCSSCKYRGKKSWKYCPNCGAKMDGKDGEHNED